MNVCRECGKPIAGDLVFCCAEHKESYLNYLNDNKESEESE